MEVKGIVQAHETTIVTQMYALFHCCDGKNGVIHWGKRWDPNMPVQIEYGDILQKRAEALVLPCNGSGIMGFVSLAGEVRKLAGRELYLTYREACPMEVGEVKMIQANERMKQDVILLACTMILPGTPIPIENVTKTAREVLRFAHERDVQSLLWPLLGAGGGRVRAEHAFRAMYEEIEVYKNETGYDPHIVIAERDQHKFHELQQLFQHVQSS